MPESSCFICEKHRQGESAEGGVVYEDDLVYAGHSHTLGRPAIYLGYLMAEPKRHVAGLGALTDDEAGGQQPNSGTKNGGRLLEPSTLHFERSHFSPRFDDCPTFR
jgi:hypothetical protein